MKKEALAHTLRRTCCRGSCGPDVRQTIEREVKRWKAKQYGAYAILVYEADTEGRASVDRWPVGCDTVQFGTRTEISGNRRHGYLDRMEQAGTLGQRMGRRGCGISGVVEV